MNEERSFESFGYKQELNRVIGFKGAVAYSLAFLGPLAVFSMLGVVVTMTHGMGALSYMIAGLAMLFTAYSYGCMVKEYPISGSAYAYVTRGINPHLGFLTGWTILIDYMLLPMMNCLLAGVFVHAAAPSIPAWAVTVAFAIVITGVNIIGIQVTNTLNTILVLIQLAFVIVFLVVAVRYVVDGSGPAALIDGSAIVNKMEFASNGGIFPIMSAASILCLSFLGFDAVTTISEETINPGKNISRAIIVVCLFATFLFTLVTYMCQVVWPDAWAEFTDPDSGASEIMARLGGDTMQVLFTIVYLLTCLPCALAALTSASRILFSMGRDGVLPKIFGYVHPKFKTPVVGILVMGAICLIALLLSVDIASSLINYGALFGFILVNVAVIVHCYGRQKRRGGANTFKYLIVPIIGALVVLAVFLSLAWQAKLVGTIWLAIGFVYLIILTKGFKQLPPDLKLDE